jgi:tripartite-type tricarboxylate transporter receptor subunit TctC
MSRRLGNQVIVENRPGGNSIIANQVITSAKPDGSTIGVITNALTVLPATSKNAATTFRDFAPITQMIAGDFALVASKSVPVSSLAELIEYGKAQPDSLNFASIGPQFDLLIAHFSKLTGVKFVLIPYKGATPARIAMLTNEVQLTFENPGGAQELADSDKARFLAVTGPSRSTVAPSIPTFAESGLPAFTEGYWFGFAAPAATPKPVVDKLRDAIIAAMTTPEFQKQVESRGHLLVGSSPEDFAKLLEEESHHWGEIAKAADVRPE